MTQGKVGGWKKFLGRFGYATTDQVLMYSQVNTPLFNSMQSSGDPVQLFHFSKEVSLLTGASSFVVFACVHHPHKSQKWIYKIKTLLIEQFIVSNLTFNVSQIRLVDLGVTLNVIYLIA